MWRYSPNSETAKRMGCSGVMCKTSAEEIFLRAEAFVLADDSLDRLDGRTRHLSKQSNRGEALLYEHILPPPWRSRLRLVFYLFLWSHFVVSIPTLQTRRQLRRQYEPSEPFFQEVKLLRKAMLERLASLFRPLPSDVAVPISRCKSL